jgi:hypothetical protein
MRRHRSIVRVSVPRRRAAPRLLAFLLALPLASCQAVQPAALESMGETVLQLADAVSALEQENALLQDQMDSLRTAVARQDTALRRFANLAGMPLP